MIIAKSWHGFVTRPRMLLAPFLYSTRRLGTKYLIGKSNIAFLKTNLSKITDSNLLKFYFDHTEPKKKILKADGKRSLHKKKGKFLSQQLMKIRN